MKKIVVSTICLISAGCAHIDDNYSNPNVPSSRAHVVAQVKQSAIKHKVPIPIALAVTYVESRFRCNAVGPMTRYGRARGPLQIITPSARNMFGYTGSVERLATCEEGLEYGMLHLAKCYTLARGDARGTAHCHVQGPHRDPFRPINAYARNYGHWVMARYRVVSGASRYATAVQSEIVAFGIVPNNSMFPIAIGAINY